MIAKLLQQCCVDYRKIQSSTQTKSLNLATPPENGSTPTKCTTTSHATPVVHLIHISEGVRSLRALNRYTAALKPNPKCCNNRKASAYFPKNGLLLWGPSAFQ